jgi:large subunit ribosomal protein L4
MELQVVGTRGAKTSKIDVADAVFAAPINEAVTHQVLVGQLANARQGNADTKTRGEVRGGGAKPYKQKGTGRARQGSIRAPHYRGGGVIFGPHPRSYEQQLPKQIRQAALRSVLSSKVAAGTFRVVSELSVPEAKTREVVKLLAELELDSRVLFLVEDEAADFRRAARNLQKVDVLPASQASVADLVRASVVVTTEAGARVLETRASRKPARGVHGPDDEA